MYDKEIAQRMEGEIQDLFGESTCQLECKPCQGKYLGHDRYTLVFGSGRRLTICIDGRNYLCSLQAFLHPMRYFRAHQSENTKRIKTALMERDTPFCGAEVEIVPYEGSCELTLYSVVILSTSAGARFVYRSPTIHGFLVGWDATCNTFDRCMKELFEYVCGKRRDTHLLSEKNAA